eukprot:Rhum_TRINITY_DN14612_c45_g1::Rhum_TRINITY_DN14612_c45_g1_i1::g.105316::m.105316
MSRPAATCRHYAKGTCRLGARCKFAHPHTEGVTFADEPCPAPKKHKWCKHRSLECCRFNGGCVYWHVEEYMKVLPDGVPKELPNPPQDALVIMDSLVERRRQQQLPLLSQPHTAALAAYAQQQQQQQQPFPQQVPQQQQA